MQTKHKLAAIGLAMALSLSAASSFAQVMVGGASMLPTKDIIDNAVNSKDHTTLVAAVKAAGLFWLAHAPARHRHGLQAGGHHRAPGDG